MNNSLTVVDVRALLRLNNALRDEPADPRRLKTRLLEGLCAIVRADVGVSLVTHVGRPGQTPATVSVVRVGGTGAEAERLIERHDCAAPAAASADDSGVDGPAWPSGRRATGTDGDAAAAAEPARRRDRRAEIDHCIDALVPLTDTRLFACLTVGRLPGRRAFGRRERLILEAFHAEASWIYRADLPLVVPGGLSLSPRERQTLQCLLAGESEKQIAARLGLRPNTIHHYVKALHRHFGVSSRSELLARWVKK